MIWFIHLRKVLRRGKKLAEGTSEDVLCKISTTDLLYVTISCRCSLLLVLIILNFSILDKRNFLLLVHFYDFLLVGS